MIDDSQFGDDLDLPQTTLTVIFCIVACLERIRGFEKMGLHGVTLSFRAGGRRERMEALSEGIIKPLKGQ